MGIIISIVSTPAAFNSFMKETFVEIFDSRFGNPLAFFFKWRTIITSVFPSNEYSWEMIILNNKPKVNVINYEDLPFIFAGKFKFSGT